MNVLDRIANRHYQAYCKAQGMYANTWERLPADRKHVWRTVASDTIEIDDFASLPIVEPWQVVEEREVKQRLRELPLRERIVAMRKAG